MRTYLTLIRQAWHLFVASRSRDTAATMALHLLMGATGLAIVTCWLAGITDLDTAVVSEQIHRLIGVNAGSLFDSLLEHADTSWRVMLPITGVSALMLWNAYHVMRHVQLALNQAVGVRTVILRRDRPQLLTKRIAGTGFVTALVLGMVVSLSAKTALEVMEYLGLNPVASNPWGFRAIEFFGALLLATLLFGFVFRMLPDAHMRFKIIWHGAFWAAKLYAFVQVVVAFAIVYVGGLSYYGEAAILLVLVAYLYLACVSFLWGTQVLRADLVRLEVRPEPSRWAVREATDLAESVEQDLEAERSMRAPIVERSVDRSHDEDDKPVAEEPAAE